MSDTIWEVLTGFGPETGHQVTSEQQAAQSSTATMIQKIGPRKIRLAFIAPTV